MQQAWTQPAPGMTGIRLFDGRQCFAAQWDSIARAAGRVFDAGEFSHAGMTAELEDAVKDYTGARFAVGTGSGTDALMLILRAIGAGPGGEVLVPALAPASTAAAVCHAGATPVFVDVEPRSYAMAPSVARTLVTSRTKAIMPSHPFSRTASLAALREIAAEAGAVLIEDSREAIGTRYAGTHAGLLGTAGALSFSPARTLGALGDAGMVITNDSAVATRCALLRHHGRADTAGRDRGISSSAAVVGINSKMDELQAAVLLATLPRLEDTIARRAELAACYTGHLAGIGEVATPAAIHPQAGTRQVWHAYVIEALQRDELAGHLAQAEIETEVPYPVPLPSQPAFRHLARHGGHPVAEQAARRMLRLPLHPGLSMDDVEYVCRAIGHFYRRGTA